MTEEAKTNGETVVVLDVDHTEGVFELVLVNLGPHVARDVRVAFSQPLLGIGGQLDVAELNVWKRIKTLRPDKEIRVLLDTAPNVFQRGKKNSFVAKVSWRDGSGTTTADYRHDLEAYRGMPTVIAEPRAKNI